MTKRRVPIVLSMLLIALAGVAAAEPEEGNATPPFLELEVPDQPPAQHAARDDASARTPGLRVGFGSYESIQVNVDSLGHNIVGDAANEPSIAVNPTNLQNIVIGWRQFDSVSSNFRQAGWSYTFDGGATWTFPGVLQPGVFRSDPVLGADSQGTFFYQSLKSNFTADVYRSTNGGASWLAPVTEFGGDKNWMTVDQSGGIGDGNIYGIWQRFSACCGLNVLTRSTDHGVSFQTPVAVSFSPTFGTMAVGPDGELYATGIDGTQSQDFSHFVVAKSVNARNPAVLPTFTGGRVDLGGFMGLGDVENPGGLLGQGNVAVDRSSGPTRGNVYVLASAMPTVGSDPLDLLLIRSTDGGTTWSAPVRVNDDPSDQNRQWFGAHSVAPNGRIDAIWNDTRNTGAANLSQLYYAYSYDAGVTWSVNVPVSPVFDSTIGWPNQNKIGDYSTIVSDLTGGNVAYAATFNGEQDVYYVRVFPDCNGNGVSDEIDITTTSTDCDGNRVPDECQGVPLTPLCVGGGTVPDGHLVTGVPLRIGKRAGDVLALTWGASCQSDDTDYEVYEGAIGDFTSHTARLCTTNDQTSVDLAPASGNTYYLIVPAHGLLEGSYGRDSHGVERPAGHSACAPRVVRSCGGA